MTHQGYEETIVLSHTISPNHRPQLHLKDSTSHTETSTCQRRMITTTIPIICASSSFSQEAQTSEMLTATYWLVSPIYTLIHFIFSSNPTPGRLAVLLRMNQKRGGANWQGISPADLVVVIGQTKGPGGEPILAMSLLELKDDGCRHILKGFTCKDLSEVVEGFRERVFSLLHDELGDSIL